MQKNAGVATVFAAALCLSSAIAAPQIRNDAPNRVLVSSVKSPDQKDILNGRALLRKENSVPLGSVISENGMSGIYVVISKKLPERLYLVYYNLVVFETNANTGIPQSPTPDGTFHVYKKERSMTMSGYNPATGMWYNDPGVKYVNFFHYGDAIHAFPRKGYGWPQSLGCVELPLKAAKHLYHILNVGTSVRIQNGRPDVVYAP